MIRSVDEEFGAERLQELDRGLFSECMISIKMGKKLTDDVSHPHSSPYQSVFAICS